MAKTVIPASNVTTCDACGVECDPRGNQRHLGHLRLERAGLDHYGHAVASNNIDLDLCDRCLSLVVDAINDATKKIKEPTHAN
jgi:hypothetical protein